MKTFRVLIPALIFVLMAMKADDTVITRLMNILGKYMDDYTSELVYIQTDRDIYKPGDELWFRGYITDELQPSLSDLSFTLYVEMCDASGNKLANHKFIIQKGLVSGNFTIPPKSQEGRYILIAYTSWMKNQPPQNVYHKEVIVKKNNFNWLNIQLDGSSLVSQAGKYPVLSGTVTDAAGSPVAGQSLEYAITTPQRTIDKGRLTTSDKGSFSCTLSRQVENADVSLMIEMKSGKGNAMLYGLAEMNMLHPPFSLTVHPEGGTLVEGQAVKTAFVVTDASGMAFPFEGNIVNSKGESIAHLQSGPFNYAVCQFKPASGEAYKLNLEKPIGANAGFPIDGIKPVAASLRVLGVKEKYIHLMVTALPGSEIKMGLAALFAGKVFWAANMVINEDRYITVPIDALPAGIVDLVLLSPEGQLVSERPVFVNHMKCPKLDLTAANKTFAPGDQVTIKMSCTDGNNAPQEATLSVSVSKLQSLSGTYDLPAFVIQNSGYKGIFDLSPLRTAPGYQVSDSAYAFYSCQMSFFDWQTIFSQSARSAPYRFREGLSGRVFDKSNKPVAFGDVTLVSGSNLNIISVKSDGNGRFAINPVDTIASGQEFILSATSADKKEKLKISLDNSFENLLRDYMQTLGYTISSNNPEVSINTHIEDTRTQFQKYYAPGKSLMDILKQLKYFNVVDNQIIFPGRFNSLLAQQGALIVIDGVQKGTDIGILNTLSAAEVGDANIYTEPSEIMRYTAFNTMGVIEIRTKRGTDPVDFVPSVTKSYQISGYTSPKDYGEYSKSHASLGASSDSRSTLLWEPDIRIGKDGKSSFRFRTSFEKGFYKVIVEGIAANGSAVYGSYLFEVK